MAAVEGRRLAFWHIPIFAPFITSVCGGFSFSFRVALFSLSKHILSAFEVLLDLAFL